MADHLSDSVSITIPEDCEAERIMAIHRLTNAAGGVTVTKGRGYWTNDEDEVIAEPVNIVTCFYRPEWWFLDMKQAVKDVVRSLLTTGHQDAVFVVKNGGATIYTNSADVK